MTIGGISVSCYIKSSRFSPKNSSAFPASSLSCNTKESVIILKILKKSVIKIKKTPVMPSIYLDLDLDLYHIWYMRFWGASISSV